MLNLIYHQFFFTTNDLGRQPTTSQFFQPLTPQTLAPVAAAIHCALSECASGKKVTVMFSEDEYGGKFYPSTVTDCISAEAIALIQFKLHMVGLLYTPPQWCSSAIIGAPQSPSALLKRRRYSSIPSGAPQSTSALLNPRQHSSIHVGAPQSTSVLLNPLRLYSIPSPLLSLDWCFDISFSAPYSLFCPRSSSRMGAPHSPPQPQLGAPLFHCRLFTSLPIQRCSAWIGCCAA